MNAGLDPGNRCILNGEGGVGKQSNVRSSDTLFPLLAAALRKICKRFLG